MARPLPSALPTSQVHMDGMTWLSTSACLHTCPRANIGLNKQIEYVPSCAVGGQNAELEFKFRFEGALDPHPVAADEGIPACPGFDRLLACLLASLNKRHRAVLWQTAR